MAAPRLPSWMLLLLAAALGLAGCEPYMSVTDRVPPQTREATALLPKSPRYVGMVDLKTAMTEMEALTGVNVLDSLQRDEPAFVREFLDATGMDPKTDLNAVYGAVGAGTSFSAVVFADLTRAQMDRYLNQTSELVGRTATYRDVPVYHLSADRPGSDEDAPEGHRDTLSLAFVRDGMIAAAPDAERIKAMVDRFRDQKESFRDNEPYMNLVKRVGRGSTAWIAGRDVLQSALQDSADEDASRSAGTASGPAVNSASIQRLLGKWSDRVLGLSEASSSFERQTGGKVERLKRRIREQAVSLTLTDQALEGEIYLKMRDESSASSIADIAKGAVAALKLSKAELDDRHRDLLDELDIERQGPVLRVRFAVDREQIQRAAQTAQGRRTAPRSENAIRQAMLSVRRMTGISRPDLPFTLLHTFLKAATSGPKGLSVAVP